MDIHNIIISIIYSYLISKENRYIREKRVIYILPHIRGERGYTTTTITITTTSTIITTTITTIISI